MPRRCSITMWCVWVVCMASEYIATIRDEIARAHDLAGAGNFASAVQSFALARAMVVDLADAKAVQKTVAADFAGFAREREMFRNMLAGRQAAGDPVVIFSDSLALPRTPDKVGPYQGCEQTYPWLLGDALGNRPIVSMCQRFFTTDDIVTLLEANPAMGAGADVVIHVGLNDCSNRMFLAVERLAMNLLPEDVRTAIVGFAQKYRRRIINMLPSRHYVPPDAFRANLDHILLTLRARKVRRVVLATIVLPPAKFWAGTPGINANFAAYNMQIMQAVARHGAVLLDIDRYVWQDLPAGPLLDDGMHLSADGHRLFAAKTAELLVQPGK
jgi:lysophospholipase L1-like esterase